MFTLDNFETAYAASDVDTDALRDFLTGNAELDKSPHLLYIFFLDPAARIEALDFACDSGAERGCVEGRDWSDTGLAPLNALPDIFRGRADRAEESYAGDDYSS